MTTYKCSLCEKTFQYERDYLRHTVLNSKACISWKGVRLIIEDFERRLDALQNSHPHGDETERVIELEGKIHELETKLTELDAVQNGGQNSEIEQGIQDLKASLVVRDEIIDDMKNNISQRDAHIISLDAKLDALTNTNAELVKQFNALLERKNLYKSKLLIGGTSSTLEKEPVKVGVEEVNEDEDEDDFYERHRVFYKDRDEDGYVYEYE